MDDEEAGSGLVVKRWTSGDLPSEYGSIEEGTPVLSDSLTNVLESLVVDVPLVVTVLAADVFRGAS